MRRTISLGIVLVIAAPHAVTAAAESEAVVSVSDSPTGVAAPGVFRTSDEATPIPTPRPRPGVVRTASFEDDHSNEGRVRTAAFGEQDPKSSVRTVSATAPQGVIQPARATTVYRLSDMTSGERIIANTVETDVPKAYVAARYVLGDGIGFLHGYSTYGYFMPLLLEESDQILFNNSRLIVTHEGNLGGNVGVGYRKIVGNYIVGGSGWFDTDESDDRHRFNQGGFGLEILGDDHDLIFNAYIPFDDDETVARIDRGTNAFFRGHQILFVDAQHNQAALRGGDIALGFPLPGNPWLKTYLGAYAYDAVEDSVQWGFRGQLVAKLTKAAEVEVSVTDDSIFGTNVLFEVGYKFGSSSKHHAWYRKPTLDQRLYEEVRRHNRIAVATRLASVGEVPAINPRTGLPYYVDHILNTAGAGGDGSFENPYNTLAAANGSTADIIAVQTGTSSAVNTINGPITLANYTRLLGQGRPHVVVDVNRGEFLLPLPTTGQMPFLSAVAGNVVNLASYNEVSAFNIDSPAGGAMIAGTGLTDFTITQINTDFLGNTSAGNGIVLANAAGTGTIRDVFVNSTSTAVGALGVSVQNTGTQPLTVALDNTNVTFPINANPIGIALVANNSTINATIANSTVTGGNHGGQVQALNGGTVNVTTTNGWFNNANQDGFNFEVAANSTVNATFNGTQFVGNGRNGVRIGVATPALGSNTLLLNNVLISNSGIDGIFAQVGSAGQTAFIDLDVTNSQVLTSGGNYFSGNFAGNTTGDVNFSNTTVTTPGNNTFNNTAPANVTGAGTLP